MPNETLRRKARGMRQVTLSDAHELPTWRRPLMLLILMATAMPLAFATWSALLNNWVIEAVGFDGLDIGLLHTVREIPGFLSFLVVFLLLIAREQMLGLWALVLLGGATAMTAWYPSLGGILMITFISSVGFHYFETINQSLRLQWLSKAEAPKILGWLVTVGSGASLLVYGLIVLTWETFNLEYNTVFLASGGACVLIALYCMVAFPQFKTPNVQRSQLILRRRYWLYYALEFLAGARRQIFVVFAGFMMVERFGFAVHELTGLYMINLLINMALGPVIGGAVARFGERNALAFEYAGLTLVFLAYGGIYYFGWGVLVAATLYVVDHILFAMALAKKTYCQKIADAGDIAPTAAVAFTISHIAAVFLPVLLGFLWLYSPAWVFTLAAFLAATSMILSLLIPRDPGPGRETILARSYRAPMIATG